MSEQGFCPRCGKVKELKTLKYCLACFKAERSDYQKVRDYIRNHPQSNAMDVAKGTGVEIGKILKYIKDKTFLLRK